VPRIRALLLNLGLALLSLGVLALAVELAARLQARLTAPPLPEGDPISVPHPVLGWTNARSAGQRIRRAEYDVTIRINSRGQRGPERDYEKPDGTRRVLLLGDSFAEGYYVPEEASARAVLERALGAACGPTEVLNGGTAGYSTDQELLLYRLEGRRYHPDLVVVFFFGNDLYYNTSGYGTAGRPKPCFELASHWKLVLRDRPAPEPARSGPPPAFAPKPQAWHGSMALRWLSDRTATGNPELHRKLEGWGLVEPLSLDPPREFLPFCPWGRSERWAVDDMWNRTSAILKRLKEEVEAEGGRLALLYVPYRFEANDSAWKLTQRRYRRERSWNRDGVIAPLQAACAELGIPLIDPRNGLRRAEASDRPAYFPIDGHWNEIGNAEAARALGAFVGQAWPCLGNVKTSLLVP
jgi:hypothetical protein